MNGLRMPTTVSGVTVPITQVKQENLLRSVERVGAAAGGGTGGAALLAGLGRGPRDFLAALSTATASAADEVADLRAQADAAFRAGRVAEAVMLAQRAGALAASARCDISSVRAVRTVPLRDQLVLPNSAVRGNYTVLTSPALYGVLSGIR